jgi:hypothetical protein
VLQGRAQLLLGDCALKLDANSSSSCSSSNSGRTAAAQHYRAARSTFHALKDTNAVSSKACLCLYYTAAVVPALV